jgi:hypothetical protein
MKIIHDHRHILKLWRMPAPLYPDFGIASMARAARHQTQRPGSPLQLVRRCGRRSGRAERRSRGPEGRTNVDQVEVDGAHPIGRVYRRNITLIMTDITLIMIVAIISPINQADTVCQNRFHSVPTNCHAITQNIARNAKASIPPVKYQPIP